MMTVPSERTRTLDGAAVDPFRCLAGGPLDLGPTGEGALSLLEFAVKEVLDVEGRVTTAGNPMWASTHPAAGRSTPTVDRLRAAGASCIATTRSDEFAFSLSGVDGHPPAPVNPGEPDRLPGGLSSGSAVAVASGLVPFALGTDTGGSIRVPASYCGVVGMRPTHGRIPTDGMVALAPSFDTVAWLAASARVAAQVGDVLLPGTRGPSIRHLALLGEAAGVVGPRVADAVRSAAAALAARLGLGWRVIDLGDQCAGATGPTPGDDPLGAWARTFRTLQLREAHLGLGRWAAAHRDTLVPSVAARFAAAAAIDDRDVAAAQQARVRLVAALLARVPPDTAIVLPSAHGPAPLLADWHGTVPEQVRDATMRLTSIAGLVGAPAVSLPLAHVDGLPIGVCLLGRPGSDLALLEVASTDEQVRAQLGDPRPHGDAR